MKILIQNKTGDKRSNIKLLEVVSTELLTDEIIRYIYEDELPIIKFTDTDELFLINNLVSKYENNNSDTLIEITEDDLLLIGSSGGGSGDSRPYKVYTALLTQSGTNAPIATVFENTIGNIVWSYVGAGTYKATLSGAFIVNKTFLLIDHSSKDNTEVYFISRISANEITIETRKGENKLNDLLSEKEVEIRVYN